MNSRFSNNESVSDAETRIQDKSRSETLGNSSQIMGESINMAIMGDSVYNIV